MARIVVIDDNVPLVHATARALRAKGHEVRQAHSGQEGLNLLAQGAPPECVVLDVEMPLLSGPEVAYEMLRHDAGLERIPIVLVSAREDLPTLAARVGTPYFLSKVATNYMPALLAVVGRALEERKAPSASSRTT